MKSEFLDLFIAQHGPRESGVMASYSDQRLRDAVAQGHMAAAQLDERKEWDARQQSALYAWQARDKKEPTA